MHQKNKIAMIIGRIKAAMMFPMGYGRKSTAKSILLIFGGIEEVFSINISFKI